MVHQGSCKRRTWKLCCVFNMGGAIGAFSSICSSHLDHNSLCQEHTLPSSGLLQSWSEHGCGRPPSQERPGGAKGPPATQLCQSGGREVPARGKESGKWRWRGGRFLDGAQLLAERENGWYLKITEAPSRSIHLGPPTPPPACLLLRAPWFRGTKPTAQEGLKDRKALASSPF